MPNTHQAPVPSTLMMYLHDIAELEARIFTLSKARDQNLNDARFIEHSATKRRKQAEESVKSCQTKLEKIKFD